MKQESDSIFVDGSVATWDMGILQGEIGGTYTGVFKFRCFLSPSHQLAAAREYRDMLGPQLSLAPEHEGHLAYALTQLKYRILNAPPFWDTPKQEGGMSGDIPDLNIILAVLNAAIGAENKYRKLKEQEKNEALGSSINEVEKLLEEESKDYAERNVAHRSLTGNNQSST